MLDSYGLLLTLSWLLAAVGIVVFARWLSRFLDRFTLESDTRLLIMIAFIGIVLFGTLNVLWRAERNVSSPIPQGQEQTVAETTDVGTFIQEHYPDLYNFRYSLRQRIKELQQFFQEVQQWAIDSPHQARFLQNVVEIQWKSLEELKKIDRAVDSSISEFWIHYNTEATNYVANVFGEESAQLIEQIKDVQAFDNTGFRAEQEETQNLLDTARQQLAHEDIPPNPKNRNKPLAFTPYNEANRKLLMDWLQTQQETTLLASINLLQNNQTEIDRKLKEIQRSLKASNDPALYAPIQKVIKLWQDLSQYNQYADYQILFAVEAEYLRQKLASKQDKEKMPDQRTLDLSSRLHADLIKLAPEIARRAQSRRVNEVERSYSPTSFFPQNSNK
jgi:hypothetical protein